MSVNDLLQRLQCMGPDDRLDVLAVREEIHDLYPSASDAERDLLMGIFKTTMDYWEQTVSPEDLPALRQAREQDYNLLILVESTDANGNISPTRYLAATSREVAAGRMSPEDETHQLALAARMTVTPPPAPQRPGLFRRLFGG